MTGGLAAGIALIGSWMATGEGPDPRLAVAGEPEVVFDWSRDACEPEDIPDAPARAFRDAAGRVTMVASHYRARGFIGPSLDEAAHDCRVIFASDEDPDPARFDDREWLYSPYTLDGRTVYSLVHVEYQGHRHRGRCPSGAYRDCWLNAITLAVSEDGGASFRHATPPGHLVAALPYRYQAGAGSVGLFSPSNIVFNPRDGFFYALIRAERYRGQARGTSVMRTPDLSDPGAWRAWNGWRFETRFVDPYADSVARPEEHLPAPVSRERIKEMVSSLTFNQALDRFLLIGLASRVDPGTGEPVHGVYYALSDDLVRWTPRRLLLKAEVRESFVPGDANPIGYPSALDPRSPSRSFETTGRRFYLYLTRFNYDAPGGDGLDRDLVRLPIEVRP